MWPGCRTVAGKPAGARLSQEPGLHLRLADPVVAERPAGHRFRRRHHLAVPVHPDRPAADVLANAAVEAGDEVLGALPGETDHVHHRVRLEGGDLFPECAGCLLGLAVARHPLHETPDAGIPVRGPAGAAHADDLVAFLEKPGHQGGPDVPCCADDSDLHGIDMIVDAAAARQVTAWTYVRSLRAEKVCHAVPHEQAETVPALAKLAAELLRALVAARAAVQRMPLETGEAVEQRRRELVRQRDDGRRGRTRRIPCPSSHSYAKRNRGTREQRKPSVLSLAAYRKKSAKNQALRFSDSASANARWDMLFMPMAIGRPRIVLHEPLHRLEPRCFVQQDGRKRQPAETRGLRQR